MRRELSLAFSSCPNDTYLFYAMVHRLVGHGGLSYSPILADVETLNQAARKGQYDVTKLSFAAIAHLQETYGLLRSGAALGRGCGPLVVARAGFDLKKINAVQVVVPGMWTTARLLTELFAGRPLSLAALPFEQIMPAVQQKRFDCGVIIHEGRFTYDKYDLRCLLDLGDWWEDQTGLPIPLGGIAIHRRFPDQITTVVEKDIAASVRYAHANPQESEAYIKQHAQEMSMAVIRQHIEMYVNDFSEEIGREGEMAIRKLFELGAAQGLLPPSKAPLFAC